MPINHRQTVIVLVCTFALSGCGVSDQGSESSGSTSQTATPSLQPSRLLIPMLSPSPHGVTTATPFPTIRVDDIKLTPVGSVVPLPTSNADAPFNQIVSVYRTSEITPSTTKAAVILLGRVQEIGSARWTTVDGQRPADPRSADSPYTIFRPVRVQVDTVLKGTYADQAIQLYAIGGVVEADSVLWPGDDLYTFNAGELILIFVNQYPTTPILNGSLLWELVDKFTILDNQAVNTYNHRPLHDVVRTITTLVGEQ